MTENEVFAHIRNLAGDYKCFDEKITYEESLILCNLIEEIQQYRTIGTADEIKSEHKELIELSRRYLKDTNELIKYQATGTVEEFKMLKDHLWTLNKIANDYSAIGTVEEFKALKEKSVAKKVIDNTPTESKEEFWYQCPNCKCDLTKIRGIHCWGCGQKLDWQ